MPCSNSSAPATAFHDALIQASSEHHATVAASTNILLTSPSLMPQLIPLLATVLLVALAGLTHLRTARKDRRPPQARDADARAFVGTCYRMEAGAFESYLPRPAGADSGAAFPLLLEFTESPAPEPWIAAESPTWRVILLGAARRRGPEVLNGSTNALWRPAGPDSIEIGLFDFPWSLWGRFNPQNAHGLLRAQLRGDTPHPPLLASLPFRRAPCATRPRGG